jgi:hypothetical protein
MVFQFQASCEWQCANEWMEKDPSAIETKAYEEEMAEREKEDKAIEEEEDPEKKAEMQEAADKRRKKWDEDHPGVRERIKNAKDALRERTRRRLRSPKGGSVSLIEGSGTC